MARRPEYIDKKITESGIEVLLFDTTVITRYGRHTSLTIFHSRKEAKEEFSKFRHGKSQLL